MTDRILDRRHVGVLRRAVAGNALVAFDFDGTLAPLVSNPDAARLPAETRGLLRTLARMCPTAVITGRARSDMAKRLVGIPLVAIIGNHGIEGARIEARARRIVRAWIPTLNAMSSWQGVLVENKGATVAVHYRQAHDKQAARRRIARAVARLVPRARVVAGEMLVNLMPDLGVHKGTALRDLMRRRGARRAVFVGDDVTDEDVFALPAAAGVLSIRVGRRRVTHAAFGIATQAQVDGLLRLLIALRAGGDAKR